MANTPGVPGIGTTRTAQYRKVLLTDRGAVYLPGGKVIKGSASRDPGNTGYVHTLRPGILLGKRTSDGKYAPSVIGALTTAYSASSDGTSLTVPTAVATEIARRLTVGTDEIQICGPSSAGGAVSSEHRVVSAVNTATGVVTLASALTNDYVVGSLVQPYDGSQTPLGLLPDGYGIKVTDEDENDIDVELPQLLIGGVVDASQIINYTDEASVQAQIKSWLRTYGVGWAFDDDF